MPNFSCLTNASHDITKEEYKLTTPRLTFNHRTAYDINWCFLNCYLYQISSMEKIRNHLLGEEAPFIPHCHTSLTSFTITLLITLSSLIRTILLKEKAQNNFSNLLLKAKLLTDAPLDLRFEEYTVLYFAHC